jgi:hypothetical protein
MKSNPRTIRVAGGAKTGSRLERAVKVRWVGRCATCKGHPVIGEVSALTPRGPQLLGMICCSKPAKPKNRLRPAMSVAVRWLPLDQAGRQAGSF